MKNIYYHFDALSKNDWLTIFHSDLMTDQFWDVIKVLYCVENHKLNAKCIAEILGINHFIILNKLIGTAGHKIYDKFQFKNPPLRENNQIRWWNIVFDGEDNYSLKPPVFYWILKNEMLSAIEEFLPANKNSVKNRLSDTADLYPLTRLYNGTDNLDGKERKAVLSVRQNQEKIRKAAIRKYNGICAISGLKIPSLLTASHIKPWACSTPHEKGDLHNILLLCPSHNALFDRFLITFRDDGTIMINEKITDEDKIKLNINDDMKIKIDEDTKKYLAYHREIFMKK